jgi:lathosterol oxidase
MSWLACVGLAVGVALFLYGGVGSVVHWVFYVRRRAQALTWKLQPGRWLSPALTRQALWLGGANMVLGSVVSGTLLWHLQHGGRSLLYFDVHAMPIAWLPLSAVLAFFLVDASLYYTHRLLHHRALFKYVHRWHHRYVAPMIFTTTAVHPVELLIFEVCLLLPMFVIPMHLGVYLVVAGYTYFIGLIDHSGVRVRWRLPLHGDNQFHDDHHVYFHCNYGHHTSVFDQLHGTVRRSDRHYDEHTFGGHGRLP